MSVQFAQYSSAVISVQCVGFMTMLTKDSFTVINAACAGLSLLIL